MFIKRSLYSSILAHLDNPEITLITGPRQCGKTYLLKKTIEFLDQNNQKTLFLNLDLEEHKKYFVTQNALISKIKLEFGDQKGFVFIDEIQRKENAGLFLKGIYDQNLPYKFIVTGSGSLELKEKIHESLAGRKRIFHLTTINFWEFINFKTNYKYENQLGNFFTIEKNIFRNYLTEYLQYGGYPKVVLAHTSHEKLAEIQEIFQSFVEKDISQLLHIEKTENIFQLLKLLAENSDNQTNLSNISTILGTSHFTLKKYLWYLEKCFVIERVSPFTRRTGREISKSPVVYFYDLGLRNYVNNSFTADLSSFDLGFNFQNLIYNLLHEKYAKTASTIHYYRTKDGAEVDFVIDSGKEIIPLEIKFSWNKPPPKALTTFVKKYQSLPGKILTSENFFDYFLP